MQIDSTKLHEELNQIAIKCHNHEIMSAVECIQAVRRVLCRIEGDTACYRAIKAQSDE